MNNLKFNFLVVILIFLSTTVFAQRKFAGKVVEVIDGKTVVIEMQSGHVTAMLQYIEIPEPQQPMRRMTADHLELLVMGKIVEFQPKAIVFAKTIGQLSVKDVDISQQMLRDGAAWFAREEKDAMYSEERESYEANEGQAKVERRGLWSVADLKPAWEYRAEQRELKKQKEMAEWEAYRTRMVSHKAASSAKSKRWSLEERIKANSNVQIWPDISREIKRNSNGLYAAYDAQYKFGFIETSGSTLELSSAGNQKQKLECRSVYVYSGEDGKPQNGFFVIAFLAPKYDPSLQKSNSLVLTADKQKFLLGAGKWIPLMTPRGIYRILAYKIEDDAIGPIAFANTLKIQLGRFSGTLGEESQNSMRQLLVPTATQSSQR